MRYLVKFNYNDSVAFETNSRDSKKVVRDYGVEIARIYNKSGKCVSAARRSANDKIFNLESECYNE